MEETKSTPEITTGLAGTPVETTVRDLAAGTDTTHDVEIEHTDAHDMGDGTWEIPLNIRCAGITRGLSLKFTGAPEYDDAGEPLLTAEQEEQVHAAVRELLDQVHAK